MGTNQVVATFANASVEACRRSSVVLRRMAMDLQKWPRTSSPLQARKRVFRAVHAIRVAARTARVEWKSVKRDPTGDTLTSHVTFRVEVEADTLDGGFVAKCLDLPGCYSQGDTEAEAVSNLVEAISGVMEARMQRHLRNQPLHSPDEDASVARRPHRHTLEIPVT
jgi:predicted RNase H-like HicB family nuclease